MLFGLYNRLFKFLFEKRNFDDSFSEYKSHFLLISTLTFIPIILLYGYVSYNFFSIKAMWDIALLCIISHCTFIALIRTNLSIHFIGHSILFSAFVYQFCFAYYSGGFRSGAIIWMAILPVIAGLALNKKSLFIWISICFVAVSYFLYLALAEIQLPILISKKGFLWADAILYYGWASSSSGLIYFYLRLNKNQQDFVKKKNEETQALLRVLCHDIANPMSVILAMNKVAQRQLQHASLDKIDKASDKIVNIIASVRTLQAIQSGKKQLELKCVNVAEVVKNMISIFEEKLNEKRIKIISEIPEYINILADASIVENQVFGNLISNAIKFSNTDSQITLTAINEGDFITIFVKDKGVGIAPENLKKLFSSSVSTSTKGTAGEVGTGFGMPIMKSYVELMSGQVDVTSSTDAENHGTHFEIKFKKAS